MKKTSERLCAVLLFVGLLCTSKATLAQVPPHALGSICFTPQFWCWANPPGPPADSADAPPRTASCKAAWADAL